jgi:hypothetical protein
MPRYGLIAFSTALVLAGCSPHQRGDAPAPEAPAASPRPSRIEEGPPRDTVRAPVETPTAKTNDPTADVHPPELDFTLEPPRGPFDRRRPEGRIEASLEDQALAVWNVGGNGDPDHVSNRPSFHPGARVLVGTTVLGGAPQKPRPGRLSAVGVLAQSRKNGYWSFRVCYEWGLRRDPSIKGSATLRFSIDSSGKVSYARRMKSELDDDTTRCLLDATRSLEFSPRPPRRVDVEASIQLWPGDAPVPSALEPPHASDSDEPRPLPTARPETRAVGLARAAVSVESARHDFARCLEAGRARDGRLWGRIELSVRIAPEGRTADVVERDSRFPDSSVVECARQVTFGLDFSHFDPVSVEFVFGLRLDKPAQKTD